MNAGPPNLYDFYRKMDRLNEAEREAASNPYDSFVRHAPKEYTHAWAEGEYGKALANYKAAAAFLKNPAPTQAAPARTTAKPDTISKQDLADAQATVRAGRPSRQAFYAAAEAEADYHGHAVSYGDAEAAYKTQRQKYKSAVQLLRQAEAQAAAPRATEGKPSKSASRSEALTEMLKQAEQSLKAADKKNYELQTAAYLGETEAEREAAAEELAAFKPERQKLIKLRNDIRAELAAHNRPSAQETANPRPSSGPARWTAEELKANRERELAEHEEAIRMGY